MPATRIAGCAGLLALVFAPGCVSAEARRANNELFRAAGRGDLAAASKALAGGANVNATHPVLAGPPTACSPDSFATTPLHAAAAAGREDMVEMLICKGAKVNARDGKGRTALALAAASGHRQIFWYAWPHPPTWPGADPPTSGPEDYAEIVRLLLARGAKVNATDRNGRSPLFVASAGGNGQIVELLLANGAKVDARTKQHYTPLHSAAGGGHEKIVARLIANGADVNVVSKSIFRDRPGHTPLYFAFKAGHLAVAERLRKAGAKLSGPEQARIDRLLWVAASKGKVDMARDALAKGADPNGRRAPRGCAPLHEAARNGDKPMAELLIAAGADVNSRGAGSTPLHQAAYHGKKVLAELLIAHGADVNARDVDGQTPLWRAASRVEMLKLLIARGADVNVRDGQGRTLLSRVSRRDVLDLLRGSGAK
jgi:ankyrin repeat protein